MSIGKCHVIYNFADLLDHLDRDALVADLCPTRLVCVNNREDYVRLVSVITSRVARRIRLSDYCEADDVEPNTTRVIMGLEELDCSATLIPITPYLQLDYERAMTLISQILQIPFNARLGGKHRIYIPMLGMSDLLHVLDISPRESSALTLLESRDEESFRVSIVDDQLPEFDGIDSVRGVREFLARWEKAPFDNLYLYTGHAKRYLKTPQSADRTIVTSAFQALRHFGVTELNEDMGVEAQWQTLLAAFLVHKSLDTSLGSLINESRYHDTLFKKWRALGSLGKWALLTWARLSTNNRYLKSLLDKGFYRKDFEIQIYADIRGWLSDSGFWDVYRERHSLIQDIGLEATEDLIEGLSDLSVQEKLQCLTDFSELERMEIIRLLEQIDITQDVIALLNKVYPALGGYLTAPVTGVCEIDNYLQTYKLSKLRNVASDEFVGLLDALTAENTWIARKLESRNEVVKSTYAPGGSAILFVDALGAEYTGVIHSLFAGQEFTVETKYGYCNWPSITSNNKDFLEGRESLNPIVELDQLKHSAISFPRSIVKELEIIGSIRGAVEAGLKSYKNVIIVADHGSSRLAVLCKGQSHRANPSAEVFKYGRYCIDSEGDYGTIRGCIRYEDYWLFSNYDRFVQQGTPLCETHGGASLEETIVPIITVQRNSEREVLKKSKHMVELLADNVRLGLDRKVRVRFSVSGTPSDVIASLRGERYVCSFEDGHYYFDQSVDGKESTFTARVLIQGAIVGEITYNVVRAMRTKKEFDI